METLLFTAFWLICFVSFKAIVIGSDFSFYWLIKDGKKYWKWYNDRETYSEYKNKKFITVELPTHSIKIEDGNN